MKNTANLTRREWLCERRPRLRRRNFSPGTGSRHEVIQLWRMVSRHARLVLASFGYGPTDAAPSPLTLARMAGVPVIATPDDRSDDHRVAMHGHISAWPLRGIANLEPHPLRRLVELPHDHSPMVATIHVDEALSPEQKRFVVGHELGHYFLELMGIGDYRHEVWPTAYWFLDLCHGQGWPDAEIACDAFAVRLCMTSHGAADYVRTWRDAFERGDIAAIRSLRVEQFAEIDKTIRANIERLRAETITAE